MKLGIDIDGVICDFVSGFKKVVKDKYGLKISEEDIIYHDLYLVLGITKEEAIKLIELTLNMDLPLIKDADKYIKILKKKHEIILMTARHINHEITKKWLMNNRIDYDNLYFLNEGHKYKSSLELDIIIEDNLNEALNWFSKVKHILVFNHPWNQCIDINNVLHRVKNWKQIYEYIEKL